MATNIDEKWGGIEGVLAVMRTPVGVLPFCYHPPPKKCDRCQAWLTPFDERCLPCVAEIQKPFILRSRGDIDRAPDPAFLRWQMRKDDPTAIMADTHDRLYHARASLERYGELRQAIRKKHRRIAWSLAALIACAIGWEVFSAIAQLL